MDSPLFTSSKFLNCYELDELYEAAKHHPYWLENDESDDVIYDDALYGVI